MRTSLVASLLIALAIGAGTIASAEDESLPPIAISPGDVAITGFSSTTLAAESLSPGVEPLDKTIIDITGPALRVFDISALGGVFTGQIVDPPAKFTVPAKDIGQVFGLAFDQDVDDAPPNLYAGATSAYGIQIVAGQSDAEGKPVRLKRGEPGARFMDGQFGGLPGGQPGTVWKIDGTTGKATALAHTTTNGVANSGPGLGGLAFDPINRNLYVSDLDTGLIHRFSLDGTDLGQFDHGITGRPTRGLAALPDDGKRMDIASPAFTPDDPSTFGFTQEARLVRGLTVHDGRLYYSVDEGPEIWSVGLNPNGSFAGDVRSELLVKADQPFPVTGIVFDGQGRMTLAHRGALKSPYDYGQFVEPGGAQVLRYTKEDPDDPATPGVWAPEPQTYAIGFSQDNKSGSGGLSLQYGYSADGVIDQTACYGTLAVTADGITPDGTGHGLQLNDAELVLPENLPPNRSAFVAYDSRQNRTDFRGHVGGVAAFHICEGEDSTPVTEGPPVFGDQPAAGYPGSGGMPPIGDPGAPPIIGQPPIMGEPPIVVDEAPAPGTLRIEKAGVSAECSADKACNFKVTVENPTDAPIPGPVAVADTLSAGAGALNAAKIVEGPNAPWTCTAAAPKFTCTHPGPIAAKATETLELGFIPGPLGDAKEVKNCALLTAKPAQMPAPPPPPVNDPPPPARTQSPGGGNLALENISPQCSATAGTCALDIVLTSPFDTTFSGRASVVSTIKIGWTEPGKMEGVKVELVSQPGDGWTCATQGAAGEIIHCSRDIPEIIPNKKFVLPLKFKFDVPPNVSASFVHTDVAASLTETNPGKAFSSTVATPMLLDPPIEPGALDGGGEAPDGDAEQACATIPVKESEKAVAGNLQISKAAVPGSCKDNRACDFNITIKNIELPIFIGPVEFDDTVTGDGALFGATTIVRPPPLPWTCVKAGQSFKCSHPGLTLEPKDKVGDETTITIGFDLGPGIGDVKEMKNCALLKNAPGPACATIPLAPAPAPGPDPLGKLQISKRNATDSCSDMGGRCRFAITVTNSGEFLEQPIEIEDQVTVGGQIIPTTQMDAVPNLPWKCLHKGQGAFSCTHPGPLSPGDTELNISIFLNAKTDATHIRNCATLKGSPASACSEIPLVNGPKIAVEKRLLEGPCRPNCKFNIDFINAGNADWTGEIIIVDHTFAASTFEVQSPEIVSFNAPWQCSKPGSIHCVHPPKVLKPLERVRLELTLKYATAKDFTAQNCAFPNTEGSKRDCVDITNAQQPEDKFEPIPFPIPDIKLPPNLAVEVSTEPTCPLTGECRFLTQIVNKGGEPYTGKLGLGITVWNDPGNGAGAVNYKISLGAGQWMCAPEGITEARTLWRCDHPQTTVNPGPGISVSPIPFRLTPAEGWTKGNFMRLCAQIFNDPAGNDRVEPGKTKEACASTKLDPFAVEIEKSGAESCVPGGECRFDLDIFNPEQILHDDPVTVTDNLVGLESAEIVSIVPTAGAKPFPCTPAPTRIPFSCSGHMKLEPSERHKYIMTIRLPKDAPASGSFRNCATIASGSAAPPQPSGAPGAGPVVALTEGEAGDEDCHEVKLGPACTGGMELNADGRCACPAGQKWDGRVCAAEEACPPGTTGSPPNCEPSSGSGMDTATEPAPTPTPPATRPCDVRACAAAFKSFRASDCTYQPTGGGPRRYCDKGSAGTPKPPPPPPASGSGMDTSKPGQTCPRGSVLRQGRCECPANRPVGTPPDCCPRGMEFKNGACRCPEGTRLSRGVCAPIPKPPEICPPNRPVGTPPNCCPKTMIFARGECRCPEGTTIRRGICVPRAPETCPSDRPMGTPPHCCPRNSEYRDGACRCLTGFTGVPPRCVRSAPPPPPKCPPNRPVGTPPNCCPQGQMYRFGKCYPEKCPPGHTGVPPRCKPPATGPAPVPVPQPREVPAICPRYMEGTPPNCRCPSGMTGPKCDQVIVR